MKHFHIIGYYLLYLALFSLNHQTHMERNVNEILVFMLYINIHVFTNNSNGSESVLIIILIYMVIHFSMGKLMLWYIFYTCD